MQPVFGVPHCSLIRCFGHAKPLNTDRNPFGIHHREHGFHALVRGADQPAERILECHLAGGGTLDPHLVLKRGGHHPVVIAQRSVRIGQVFGHEEQADPLNARRRIGQAGQHQMDDIIRQIVVAAADENLVAADAEAVTIGHGLGAELPQIGAAMRFRQAHRTRPFAADQLGHIRRLQLVRSVNLQRHSRAVGQAGIQPEADIGGTQHFLDHLGEAMRRALPAPFGAGTERGPASFAELLVRGGEAIGGADNAVFDPAALLIAGVIQWQQHFAAHLRRFFHDRFVQIGGEIIEPGQVAEAVVGVEFFQREPHVADRGVVGLHVMLSFNF